MINVAREQCEREPAAEPARECAPRIFQLDSSSVAVETDDAWTAQLLDTAYAAMRGGQEAPAGHTACAIRLSDGRLRLRFDSRDLRVTEGGPGAVPFLTAFYAVRDLFVRFALAQPGWMPLYGASFATSRGAHLILAPTAIGKTVLALHLAHGGAQFLGDETALLHLSSGTVRALPRLPAMRESALALLPSEDMRQSVERSENVYVSERGRFWYALGTQDVCGIAPTAKPYPLRSIYIVRGRGDAAAVRETTIAQALPAIAQRAYARPNQLAELAALRRALRSVRCYELTIGDPVDTRSLIGERACA